MSKLITDSKVLMDLLFDGCAPDDTEIHYLITHLKEAALSCLEICVAVDYEDHDVLRKRLADINYTITTTWSSLASLQNDFKDLIDEHFKKWYKENGIGGEK